MLLSIGRCLGSLLPLLIIAATCPQGSEATWASGSLLQRLGNKTMEMKHYVTEKGENISSRIQDYLASFNHNVIEYAGEKTTKIGNSVSEYVNVAARKGKELMYKVLPLKRGDSEANPKECTSPESHLTTPQLIALHGYKAESHTVRTDDGYLLTLHRIPHRLRFPRTVPRKTVLLHHGILGSSADWVLAGPGHSLAYILADAGYDVWMANVRGNVYSKAHVTISPSSHEFWNYTWHEIATHDLPAVIEYIAEVKEGKQLLSYVGHSMGTTVLFALLSTKPEYNKKLHAGFALAPIAYMSAVRSPVRLLAPFAHNVSYLLRILGMDDLLPQNRMVRWLADHACEMTHFEQTLCENTMFILCGYDESQFNRSLLATILGHTPAGISTKTLVHYAQEIASNGAFQQFDYGSEQNLIRYGTKTPPHYNLRNIKLPIALLSAKNDWLSGEQDVKKLFRDLPNVIEHFVVPLPQFNHIDFLWAKDAPQLVYYKLLKLMAAEFNTTSVPTTIKPHLVHNP